MRTTFINVLTEMATIDDKIVCVIGDTGFSVFENFEKRFNKRFINVGIAEQNFIGIGAGLAAMGMKPFLYNVVSFMTLRATEQIMLDICYQENPVRLIGVGGGFAYSNAGPTHHSLQDIAIMTAMPGMTVVCPGDPSEMKAVMLSMRDYDKPIYVRIGRSVDPIVHQKEINFKIGKAIWMTEGKDTTLIVSGTMLKEAIEIEAILRKMGVEATLISMPTIKPIDREVIVLEAMSGKPIFTIEEHSIVGGLGDAVGRVILEEGLTSRLYKIGVADMFAPVTGSREYLLNLFGMSPEKIVSKICKIIR